MRRLGVECWAVLKFGLCDAALSKSARMHLVVPPLQRGPALIARENLVDSLQKLYHFGTVHRLRCRVAIAVAEVD